MLAYVRWDDRGNRVVVALNFSDKYLAGYQIPHFPASGKWLNWMTNGELEANEDSLLIDLGEYEAKIIVHQY